MRAIGEERATPGKHRPAGNHRYVSRQTKVDDALAILNGEAISKQRDCLWGLLRHLREGVFQLFPGPCRIIISAYPKLLAVLLRIVAFKMFARVRGVCKNGDVTQ